MQNSIIIALTSSGITQKLMNFSPSAGPNVKVPLKGKRSVLFMSTICQSTVTVSYLPKLLKIGTWAVMFIVGVLSSEMIKVIFILQYMIVIGKTLISWAIVFYWVFIFTVTLLEYSYLK